MEIEYTTTGFLKDVAYTADLYNVIKEFETSSAELESLEVNIDEILPQHAEIRKKPPFTFSADGKKCVINLTFFRYRNAKNKITEVPTPNDVFTQLRFVLNKASSEYKSKFP
jgi:hypothetical protein